MTRFKAYSPLKTSRTSPFSLPTTPVIKRTKLCGMIQKLVLALMITGLLPFSSEMRWSCDCIGGSPSFTSLDNYIKIPFPSLFHRACCINLLLVSAMNAPLLPWRVICFPNKPKLIINMSRSQRMGPKVCSHCTPRKAS